MHTLREWESDSEIEHKLPGDDLGNQPISNPDEDD
jgi:hypothetical protein